MAESPIVAEVTPPSGVTILLYANQAGQTSSGTVFITNHAGVGRTDTVGVALVPNGQSLSDASYICRNTTVEASYTVYLQQIYLGDQDRIYVVSQNGTSNFVFTGTIWSI